MSQDVISFMVRFVRDANESQEVRWRGIIKHVQGNNDAHFTQFNEAVTFMQDHVNEMIRSTFTESENGDPFNPFLETARMWEDMVPKYTQMWMDTMKQTIDAANTDPTAAWTKQFESAMASFQAGTPFTPKKEQTIEELKAEIELLKQRISELENTN